MEEKKTIDDGIVYMKNEDNNQDEDLMDDEEIFKDDVPEDGDEEENEEEFEEDGDEDSELDDQEQQHEDDDMSLDSIDEFVNGGKRNENNKSNCKSKGNQNNNKSKDDLEIENPLRKKKNSQLLNNNNKAISNNTNTNSETQAKEEDNLSYDSDEEEENKKLIGRKQKRDNSKKTNNNVSNSNNNEQEDEQIQQVPNSDSEYDIDEIAEIRAIAKKMLRKKDRLDVLYKTYNRYAFSDLDLAPDWFASEEKLHNQPIKPVTKEEVQAEKEMLKQINDRMPKKILEAKGRKKKKLAKRLDKVKKKAQVISNQEEINEFSKLKQIQKLYKREMYRSKEKKKYVVARSFKVDNRKNTRNIKHVDKRMKKDKRAMKAAERRKKRR